ncbi:uncharacterized protein EHS24_003691 [Apiotrichum porosum]|uniref:Rhodanese domain-containing protein n=1 Tax=Apiotrichum porosum TaxID=105984 RepID=A0A427XDY0_9TREE|nr:uncharacterized protein EHS24_003691 [Apiotrichum porosum]RSH77065.1 hypothetical protein EHS24_003691 [Apiotrichum porosum]
MFDPHAQVQLVRPAVTAEDAVRVAAQAYGLTGTVKELGSNQDRNYLLTPIHNSTESEIRGQRYLLKFDNDVFSEREIQIQNEALLRLAEHGVSVPTPVRDMAGEWISAVDVGTDGRRARARLLTFVEGTSLVDDGYLSPHIVAEMGRLAGQVVAELANLTDPALERDLQWDMRNAMAVVNAYNPEVSVHRREHIRSAATRAWDVVRHYGARLPVQPIHGDITDDNIVGPRDEMGRVVPQAIIDWGDLATGWRVAELAVTVSSILHHQGGRALDVMPAIAAFDAIAQLTDAEIIVLWPLVILRGAVLVVSGAHQVALEPENDYARERMEHEWNIFATADSLNMALAHAAIRAATGRMDEPPPKPERVLVPKLDSEAIRLDASSPHLHCGAWAEKGIEERLAAAVTARGKSAVFAYGEHRLTLSPPAGSNRPNNTALTTELFLPKTTQLVVPFPCYVDTRNSTTRNSSLILAGTFGEIQIDGDIESMSAFGSAVAGEELCTVTANSRLTIQWRRPGISYAPEFTDADALPAWRRLTVDPAVLLGIEPAHWIADTARERERRTAAMPTAAERYYDDHAPQIERGWRDLLIDTNGRAYVDMVNNVASVGHAHPVLANAVNQQMLTLNTNSRFLYSVLAEYIERLVALAPDPTLSVVMLVNSGSEAVDLAMHLAKVHTGRKDVVVLREGYHGWTMATDAVSTSAFDNPAASGSRPAWVHVADAVNTYRGPHRRSDAADAYAADVVTLLDDLDSKGTPAGAFLCEPVFGNGGGIVYPAGYLQKVYAAVRERGGVCIADEVQVGLGRLGHYTWGVEQQGVVPDIMAVAKALGGGYPLGCVYTTPAIAASLEGEGMFFSSAGGSTASAAAGLAVLDIIRDEGLQQHAAAVGDHLASRLEALRERHLLVGAIHGMGLYQGVELVLDRDTRAPAVNETAWICDRMLDHGVIVQATSERRNVLKVKPPLTLTTEHADVFVDALEKVLYEVEARFK